MYFLSFLTVGFCVCLRGWEGMFMQSGSGFDWSRL